MMSIVVICVAWLFGALFFAVIAKAALVAWRQRRDVRLLAAYQGPTPTFPFGNAAYRLEHHGRVHEMQREMNEKYCVATGLSCFKLLGPSFMSGITGNELVTADPRVVKHVLSDHFDVWAKSNEGGRVLSSVIDFLGVGIFTIDHGPYAEHPADSGKMWHTQRRTAASIFTRGLFKTFYEDVFVSHTKELLNLFKEKVGNNGEPINFQHWMHALTMDCFGQIGFGADLGNLTGRSGFGEAFDSAHNQVLLFLAENIKGLVLRELLPFWLGDLVQTHFIEKRCPIHQELLRNTAFMAEYTQKLIDDKRNNNNTNNTTQQYDLLSLFMSMEHNGGDSFTDESLRSMITNFMIAGRDTTATTLSWMFYRLGLKENAVTLKTLIDELDAVLQGATPTHDDITDLPFLRGCVWEALRLHPVVPSYVVISKKDDVLPDGVMIPKNTQMNIASYAMGRSKERYGEDVEEFKPDRWIPFVQPSPYEFPMFKAGRRICLGKDMAIFEISTIAVMLLQQYTPEVVQPELVTWGSKITMNVMNSKTGNDELMMRMIPR